MAIIYTYPVKGTPLAADLLLISDTADGNKSKNATIASLVTSNAIDVVDTLNSLKGDINITGGTNITVTPSGQNIEISTSASNVDGSGTAYKIPMWSDSNTLTNSPFETSSVGTGVLDIPNYIRHIGDTGCFFGFNSARNNEFLVYTESDDQESLRITPTGTAIKTNATNRFTTTAAGAIELYYAGAKKFETTTTGSTLTGGLSLSDGTNNVTISIPTITTSYDLKMPASIGTASQVLKLPSTLGTSPYQLEWSDASGITTPISTANGGIGASTLSVVYNLLIGNGASGVNNSFTQSGDSETAIQLPVGPTNRRPTAELANVGLIRYNSTLTKFEGVAEGITDGSPDGTYSWVQFSVS